MIGQFVTALFAAGLLMVCFAAAYFIVIGINQWRTVKRLTASVTRAIDTADAHHHMHRDYPSLLERIADAPACPDEASEALTIRVAPSKSTFRAVVRRRD